jgi:hypothetical protein
VKEGGSASLTGEVKVAGKIEVTDGGSAELGDNVTVELGGGISASGTGSTVSVPPGSDVPVETSGGGEKVIVEEPVEPTEPEEPGVPSNPSTPSIPPILIPISDIPGIVGPGADADLVAATEVTSSFFDGRVSWSPSLDNDGKFSPNTLYTATITLTPAGGYGLVAADITVEGAKTTHAAGSGVVTAVFSGVRVDDISSLNAAVAAAKSYGDGGVVYLSSAFYSSANTAGSAIVVDANNTDNDVPYTIKGTSGDTLQVGILLANDNVTLDGVQINITDSSKAAITGWSLSPVYKAGISIGRSSNGTTLLTGANMASTNVTIRNTDVTVNFSSNGSSICTSGIWVSSHHDGSNTIYPSTGITLDSNTVRATGYGQSAVAALAIQIWHPSVQITNNTLVANYGTSLSGSPAAATTYPNAPANAIFFNRVMDASFTGGNGEPVINGNTLTSDVYSFYINACPGISITGRTGVSALTGDKFGNADTTWVLSSASDQDSTFKKLVEALVHDTTGTGFGYIANLIAGSGYGDGYIIEEYEISSRAVEAINVWGKHISSGTYTTNGNNDNAFAGNGNAAGYDYGRKLIGTTDNYDQQSDNTFTYRLGVSDLDHTP